VKAPVILGPLTGNPIWYEDSTRKQLHRDLVLAGMERARQQGKRIGRPRVRERPDFDQRFIEVVGRIGLEGITRTQAARELGIGYATLKRLLDAQGVTEASTEFG
jgi:DNA invertase Pin-like site-specific DNA recombinase